MEFTAEFKTKVESQVVGLIQKNQESAPVAMPLGGLSGIQVVLGKPTDDWTVIVNTQILEHEGREFSYFVGTQK